MQIMLTEVPDWLMLLVLLVLLWFAVVFYYMAPYYSKQNASDKPSYDWQQQQDTDVVIVGSGVLGSALATTLARDGRRVTVVERDMKQPDRIVGELLQPGGYRALQKLGLTSAVFDVDAQLVNGYVLQENENQVHIPYPEPCTARAFHHGRFVQALRAAALDEDNVTYKEGSVSKMIEGENNNVIGVEYTDKITKETKSIFAPLVVVADGCFSKFRKSLVKEKPTVGSHFVGLLMKDCPQIKANHAELVLADPWPVLVYRISEGDTRILVDIQGALPRNMKEYLKETVCPELPEHLHEAFICAVDEGPVRSMPNSCLPSNPIHRAGVVCLGDALNMRHPLTGGGMSVALNDVVLFRNALREVDDLTAQHSTLAHIGSIYWQRNSNHSFVVNVLAQALYQLFATKDADLRRMKAACFSYFQLGGQCVSGPVGLLSVLNPRPAILLCHFFAVAVYGIVEIFRSEHWYRYDRAIISSWALLAKACKIICPLVWGEMKTLVKM